MKVYSIFKSLQGEGLTIGAPTAFIRTSGCPLRCTYCDTPQAFDKGEEMTLDQVMKKVAKHRCRHVCLTGGEPMAQKETPKLLVMLLDEGYRVVLETNGAMSLDELPCVENLTISMDIKCPSSGEADKMIFKNLELLGPTDQLKFIIADDVDYAYAKKVLEEYSPKCEVIFTPVGGKELKSLAEKVLKANLNVRVLPQLHKFIWGDADNR
ncbi:MAG: 7-carboxy-7-deazaguanine synthase QueE [Euryarchaeota archaeon RBG_13_57_23]|nr:MAG: 7-carboxy-7-deazaguanine synthase QueE [Euryarchaeota archaeon RBG_13_57_23]